MTPAQDGRDPLGPPQTLLEEALRTAVFTAEDLDQAYADGREDLASVLAELIEQSDFEITNHDILRFVEAEIGFSGDDIDVPRGTRDPSWHQALWADDPALLQCAEKEPYV